MMRPSWWTRFARQRHRDDLAATQSFAEFRYAQYLGLHGQFKKSLGHVARAIDLLGVQGERWSRP